MLGCLPARALPPAVHLAAQLAPERADFARLLRDEHGELPPPLGRAALHPRDCRRAGLLRGCRSSFQLGALAPQQLHLLVVRGKPRRKPANALPFAHRSGKSAQLLRAPCRINAAQALGQPPLELERFRRQLRKLALPGLVARQAAGQLPQRRLLRQHRRIRAVPRQLRLPRFPPPGPFAALQRQALTLRLQRLPARRPLRGEAGDRR
ncbi:hypothetical protein D3C74_232700 [compost metagenome]